MGELFHGLESLRGIQKKTKNSSSLFDSAGVDPLTLPAIFPFFCEGYHLNHVTADRAASYRPPLSLA